MLIPGYCFAYMYSCLWIEKKYDCYCILFCNGNSQSEMNEGCSCRITYFTTCLLAYFPIHEYGHMYKMYMCGNWAYQQKTHKNIMYHHSHYHWHLPNGIFILTLQMPTLVHTNAPLEIF